MNSIKIMSRKNIRYQIRFGARTPSEIRKEAFVSETPVNYRIP